MALSRTEIRLRRIEKDGEKGCDACREVARIMREALAKIARRTARQWTVKR